MNQKKKRRSLLQKFIIVMGFYALMCIAGYVFLLWGDYEAQFFDTQEVQEICRTLNLDLQSAFCREAQRNDGDSLKNAVIAQFPPLDTTADELASQFNVPLIFATPSCAPSLNYTCPTEAYAGGYFTTVSLPNGTKLFIDFDANGVVQSYSVYKDTS